MLFGFRLAIFWRSHRAQNLKKRARGNLWLILSRAPKDTDRTTHTTFAKDPRGARTPRPRRARHLRPRRRYCGGQKSGAGRIKSALTPQNIPRSLSRRPGIRPGRLFCARSRPRRASPRLKLSRPAPDLYHIIIARVRARTPARAPARSVRGCFTRAGSKLQYILFSFRAPCRQPLPACEPAAPPASVIACCCSSLHVLARPCSSLAGLEGERGGVFRAAACSGRIFAAFHPGGALAPSSSQRPGRRGGAILQEMTGNLQKTPRNARNRWLYRS